MLRRPPRDKPASRTAAATAKPAASASPLPQPLHVLYAVALLLAALAYRPTEGGPMLAGGYLQIPIFEYLPIKSILTPW